jgi:hypothetical protein
MAKTATNPSILEAITPEAAICMAMRADVRDLLDLDELFGEDT